MMSTPRPSRPNISTGTHNGDGPSIFTGVRSAGDEPEVLDDALLPDPLLPEAVDPAGAVEVVPLGVTRLLLLSCRATATG